MPLEIYSFISGRPATLVRSDSIPAIAEALSTIIQFTPSSMAVVPIVAITVCATVFAALIPAAFSHTRNFFFVISPLYSI